MSLPASATPDPVGPGPVESTVEDEIGGLAADARPGLAQAALAMARILDNPKAVNQQPAAAKVLAALLDKLRLMSTLSGQLTVRLQVFGYLTFTAARYPQSTAEITGLTAPTF